MDFHTKPQHNKVNIDLYQSIRLDKLILNHFDSSYADTPIKVRFLRFWEKGELK